MSLTVFSVFLLRRSQERTVYQSPMYPVPQLLFLGMSLWVLGYLCYEQGMQVLIGIALLIVGSLTYIINEYLEKNAIRMDSLSSFLGKKKSVSKGVLWAVIGAVFMSLDPLFIRSSGVSGYDTVFLFGLYTSVSMAILVQQQEKRTIISVIRRDGWPLVLTSLLMLGSATAFVLSVKKTTVANAFMIQAATPAVAALLGWLLLKEKTKTSTWLAIIGVTVGVGIVVQGSLGSIHWEGDLLALVSVFCVAMIFTVLRKYPEMNRIALVGLGGFLLAVSMFMNAQPATYSWKTWGVMAVMGLLTAPLGRVAGMMATRYIKASEVTLTLMLQNVLAPVLAWYIFDEVPSLSTILGGGLLFSTVLLYTLSLVFRENSTA